MRQATPHLHFQRHLPLLSEELSELRYRLIDTPNETVKRCGQGYDVLRDAALGKPVYDWIAEKILAGLEAWRVEACK